MNHSGLSLLRGIVVLALALIPSVGCGDEMPPADGGNFDASADTATDAGDRPPAYIGPEERRARIISPPQHDGVTPLPLVILLHGYTATAGAQDLVLGTSFAARSVGYYLIMPEGTVDSDGAQFWNATPVCCDFDGTGVDDVAYLASLLDEAEAHFPIDTGRVYFVGHSNGGYMSYRVACELSERVTGIMVLAGSDYGGEMDCVPAEGVSVLHIHGTLDDAVLYDGSDFYPSAFEAVTRWAGRAGCDPEAITELAPIDIEVTTDGAETSRQRWETGCAGNHAAELWTMTGVGHLPIYDTRMFGEQIAEWLFSHEK